MVILCHYIDKTPGQVYHNYTKVSYDTFGCIRRCVFIPINKTSTKSDVDALLKDVRTAIDDNKIIYDTRKAKNIETLTRLALTYNDVFEEIYSLSFDDFESGPEKHHDHPDLGEVWKFKKVIFSQIVYIKLWVRYTKDGKVAVMSFHIDNM